MGILFCFDNIYVINLELDYTGMNMINDLSIVSIEVKLIPTAHFFGNVFKCSDESIITAILDAVIIQELRL